MTFIEVVKIVALTAAALALGAIIYKIAGELSDWMTRKRLL